MFGRFLEIGKDYCSFHVFVWEWNKIIKLKLVIKVKIAERLDFTLSFLLIKCSSALPIIITGNMTIYVGYLFLVAM